MKIRYIKEVNKIKLGGEFLVVSIEKGDDNVSTFINKDGVKTIVIKIKDFEKVSRRNLILLSRKIVVLVKKQKAKKMLVLFTDFLAISPRVKDFDLGQVMAESFVMANYEFNDFKKKPASGFSELAELVVVGASSDAKRGIAKGVLVAEEINKARTLANTPGGNMTPKILADKARLAVKGAGVKVTILDEGKMKKLKMGAVLGVAQGSDERPKFIVMEYYGAGKSVQPIVLVGKGVTFDSGGLNLKPTAGILGMNMDMSGGGAVIHTIATVAKLKLKKNVVALIPAVENMISGSAFRPGDILTSMSGKTIEILNTDAEGRVILADALTYANKYNPLLVVDVATLTGSAVVALGQYASAILTKDDKLRQSAQEWGEQSGDYVWPLPMWSEYKSGVKGIFGDVVNAHNKNIRYGDAIHAGMFLQEFTQDYKCPWMHIDIAPRMEATADEFLSKGSVGAPVRLLLRLVEEFK